MKIGFIGLGIMGSRMAANLLKKGHELIVHNRTKDKVQPLLDQGASWAASPVVLVSHVNIPFTMLSKPDAVTEVALVGKQAFLGALRPDSLWIDCSSVNPSFTKRMASEAKERRVRFLDAPVAGSKGPAEQEQLRSSSVATATMLTRRNPCSNAWARRCTILAVTAWDRL